MNKEFLLHFLKCHTSEDMMTYSLKPEFTLPRTSGFQGPLVEALDPKYVGQATVFVSHAYKYKVADSIECMLRYEEEHPGRYFWFDPFSMNQHAPGVVETSQLEELFGGTIREIGKAMLVFGPWDKPLPLTRAWFVFRCFWNYASPQAQIIVFEGVCSKSW